MEALNVNIQGFTPKIHHVESSLTYGGKPGLPITRPFVRLRGDFGRLDR